MEIISQRKRSMTVKTLSPGGQISGKCRKGRSLTASACRPGSYVQYAASELETQLAQLLTLLAKRHERAWSQILLEAGRVPATDPTQVDQETWKKYLVEQANIAAVGAGTKQHVRFTTLGGNDFTRIADGTLSTLAEDEFAADAIAASANLQRSFNSRCCCSKTSVGVLVLPRSRRNVNVANRKQRKSHPGKARHVASHNDDTTSAALDPSCCHFGAGPPACDSTVDTSIG